MVFLQCCNHDLDLALQEVTQLMYLVAVLFLFVCFLPSSLVVPNSKMREDIGLKEYTKLMAHF